MPVGSMAPLPTASLVDGMPKSMMPPRPRSAASAAAFLSESRVCWTTPGIELIGTGSVMSSRTKTGRISWLACDRRLADEAPQRRGTPQPSRPDDRPDDIVRLAPAAVTSRAPCGGAVGLRSLGLVTGSPAASRSTRRLAPKSARASTRTSTSGFEASTSTRRPCSSAVFAVAGPMTAMIVEGCGLPAMPTRLRTVEDEVKTTASNLPVLIASRVSAGGGVARTVR